MQTGTFFVHFVETPPHGFDLGFPYPVLAIDVIDDQETRFLLADRTGTFAWIDMRLLRRSIKTEDRPRPAPSHKTPPQFRAPAR